MGQLDACASTADRELVARRHRDQALLQRGDERLAQSQTRAVPQAADQPVLARQGRQAASAWFCVESFAVVLDLYSRMVVGWAMSSRMTSPLVTDALVMAIWRRGRPEALLHHSDQGSQYSSEQFQRLLADHGIAFSMSRAGDAWDNSAMGSFFASPKVERVNRRAYATRDEAKADVCDFVERFYNPR